MNDPTPASTRIWLRLLASAAALACGIVALMIAILLVKNTLSM